jgi:hypothetical protein
MLRCGSHRPTLSIGSQVSNPADRNEDPRSCRLAPCLVFNNEAVSHTQKDQSQIVRCSGPLPCIVKTPYLEFGAG